VSPINLSNNTPKRTSEHLPKTKQPPPTQNATPTPLPPQQTTNLPQHRQKPTQQPPRKEQIPPGRPKRQLKTHKENP